MNVNFLGEWLEVPNDMPRVVAYDPSLPHSDNRPPVNHGCPVGYSIQYQPDGWGGTRLVCRLLDDAYMTDPSIRERETAMGWTDFIAVYGGAILDPSLLPRFFTEGVPKVLQWAARTTGQTAGAVIEPLIRSPWLLAGLLVGGVYVMTRKRS